MNVFRMKNDKHRRLLREFKEAHGYTWDDVGRAFGRSRREMEDWAGGQRGIPDPYKRLLEIFTQHPRMFAQYRLDR